MDQARKIAAIAWRVLTSERAWAALLLALSAFALVQGGRRLMVGRHERAVLKLLVARKSAPPERSKSKPAEAYDQAIMGHGMIGQRLPIRLWGILGDSALFGTSSDDAQPAKAGEVLPNGDKVVEVRVNDVALEKDGKRRTEVVFEELKMPPPAGPAPQSGGGPGVAPGPAVRGSAAPAGGEKPADAGPKAEPKLPGADAPKATPSLRTESK